MYEATIYKTRHKKWASTMKWTVWDGDTPTQQFFYFVPVDSIRQILDKIQMFIEDMEEGRAYYDTDYQIEVDRCVIDASNHRTIGTTL